MQISINIQNDLEIEWINNNMDKLNYALTIGIRSLMMGGLKNDNINDIIERSVRKEVKPINDKIEEVFNLKNSCKKGQIGENLSINYLKKLYPYNEIIDTTKTPHFGDCLMKIDNIGDILYEFKLYETIVNKKEIDKFYKDLDENNINYGIFISYTSGIVGKKKHIEWEYNNNNKLIIFISRLGMNEISLELSTNLLISMINNNNNRIINVENNIYKKIINDFLVNINNQLESSTKILEKIKNIKKNMNNSLDNLYELFNNSISNIKDTINKYNTYLEYKDKEISFDLFINSIDKYYVKFIKKIINIIKENRIDIIYINKKIKLIKNSIHYMDILIIDKILIKFYINKEDIISYNCKYEYIDNNISINTEISKENINEDIYLKLLLNKINNIM